MPLATLELPRGRSGAIWLCESETIDRITAHHHREPEFNLIISGRGRYIVDDAVFDLTPGVLIWLMPGQEHVLVDHDTDFSMWISVIRPGLLRRLTTHPDARPLRQKQPSWVFCKTLNTAARDDLSHRCDRGSGLAEPWLHDAALGHLWMAAWAAHRDADEQPQADTADPMVAAVCRVLRDEAQPCNVEQLAERFGVSSGHLSRTFKKHTGVTLTHYRQRVCLARFTELYGHGERLNLTEAALRAGFGSYPQFHRVFNEHFGYPPAEYRRRRRSESV